MRVPKSSVVDIRRMFKGTAETARQRKARQQRAKEARSDRHAERKRRKAQMQLSRCRDAQQRKRALFRLGLRHLLLVAVDFMTEQGQTVHTVENLTWQTLLCALPISKEVRNMLLGAEEDGDYEVSADELSPLSSSSS